MTRIRFVALAFMTAAGLLVPTVATGQSAAPRRDPGTFFLVELQSGVGGFGDAGQLPDLSYGLSVGTTFKPWGHRLRWYVLGTVAARTRARSGVLGSGTYSTERDDVDLYLAQRFVMPVARRLRLFAEGGIGQRFSEVVVSRSDIDTFTESNRHFLVVLAAGVQARLSRGLSLGLRAEMFPMSAESQLVSSLTDEDPAGPRWGALAQLGFHF